MVEVVAGRRVVTGVLLLGAIAAYGLEPAPGRSAGPFAELAECRFLSLGGEAGEERRSLDPVRLATLFEVLRGTRIGAMVSLELEKFRAEGIGEPARRMQFFEVRRDAGPAAEYFESGEMHFSSALFEGLDAQGPEARSRLYTAASFVVHEGVHAIAHHLHARGAFPVYRADTKVNEALAYFIQGLFLEEVRGQDPQYREIEALPAWDLCTARIVRILRARGIGPETGLDEAYDRIAEWQLEADETTALRLARLWQYFQFIHASGEAEALWRLDEADMPQVQVVDTLLGMIASDVEQRHCNLDETFAFMRDRIILYGHYPDVPPDTTACQYFGEFVRALRAEGEVSDVLRGEIDRWLAARGLGGGPGEPR
jgi:hypothetical protein